MVKETFTHKTRVPKVDGGKKDNFIRQVAENNITRRELRKRNNQSE